MQQAWTNLSLSRQAARLRRGCIWFLVILSLALILACVGLLLLIHKAYAQGIQESAAPLDVVLILDHSNSMWDLNGSGSDPNLMRVDAADLFISYLGVGGAAAGHRLAVIHFGTAAKLIAPLTALDSAGQRAALRQAIANPERMGRTDPLAALTRAVQFLRMCKWRPSVVG